MHGFSSNLRRRLIAFSAAGALLATSACGGSDADSSEDGVTSVAGSAESSGSDDPSETPVEDSIAVDGDDSEPSPTSADDGGAEAGFDPNASISISYVVPPTNLDPQQSLHIGYENYWRASYDTLFSPYTGSPEPWLAESLEFSDDGLEATITLRSGVTFHDGSPVNADAVVASIERGKSLEGSTAAAPLSGVTAVEAVDDVTVVLTLDQYNPELDALLTGPAGVVINPAAIESGADLALDPGDAGSGPYRVTEFIPSDRVVYERAPVDYFHPEFQRLAGITAQGIGDFTTAGNAVQSGQLDVAYLRLPVEEIQSMEDSGLTVGRYQAWGALSLFLRNTRGELNDPLVRQAISQSIDRDAVSEGLYSGACTVSEQIYPEGYPLHVDGLEPFPYDLDAARDLLAEAGVPDGFSMEIYTAGNAESENIATVFQQSLGEIGINATVTPSTSSDGNAAFAAGDVDGRTTVAALNLSPLNHLQDFFLDGGRNHLLGPEGDEVNALVQQLRDPSIDEDEFADLQQQIGEAITELSLVVPVCFSESYLVGDPSVINIDDNKFMWSGSFMFQAFAVASE